jgi:hypothetical protein
MSFDRTRHACSSKAAADVRPLMAGTTRSRRLLTAAAEQSGNHTEGLLPGLASNSTSRPQAVLRDGHEDRVAKRSRKAGFRRSEPEPHFDSTRPSAELRGGAPNGGTRTESCRSRRAAVLLLSTLIPARRRVPLDHTRPATWLRALSRRWRGSFPKCPKCWRESGSPIFLLESVRLTEGQRAMYHGCLRSCVAAPIPSDRASALGPTFKRFATVEVAGATM